MKKPVFTLIASMFIFSLIAAPIAAAGIDYRGYLTEKIISYSNKVELMIDSDLPGNQKIAEENFRRGVFIFNNFDQLNKELIEKGFTKDYKMDNYLNNKFISYQNALDAIFKNYLDHLRAKFYLSESSLPNTKEIGVLAKDKFKFFSDRKFRAITALILKNTPPKKANIAVFINEGYYQK